MSRLQSIAIALSVGILSLPQFANAEMAQGPVSVLGCHNTDDTCWVTIEGFTKSAYCNESGEIRWNAGTSWGKRWYATIVAAQIAGKRVTLHIAETYCSEQHYPTFDYGLVSD